MNVSKLTLYVLIPVFAVFLSGCGKEQPIPYTVNLEIWGLFDSSDAYADAINAYRLANKDHVGEISYRKMSEETYQEDLIRAFADGKGPDIFLVRNAWLPKFETLIASAPVYEFSEKEYRDAFVDVVADDFLIDGKAYGVPLSVDSLALYYNKDIFNAAGITAPPTDWESFLSVSRALTTIDSFGNISQSGAALGTAKNVNRSSDILLARAFQEGAGVTSKGFRDQLPISSEEMRRAADFYSQFARLGSEQYSWNSRQHYSIDAFYEGTLGMMLNYSWHIDTLRRKNAKLNFGTATMPQILGGQPANYANYWSFVVAKNKATPESAPNQPASFPQGKYNDLRIHESWQFLHYFAFPHPSGTFTLRNPLSNLSASIAVKDDPAKKYLEQTGKPAARRDLVEEQKRDARLSPFAYGNLVAKSWRIGDIERAEGILSEAIESVSRGEAVVPGALGVAENQIRILDRANNTY